MSKLNEQTNVSAGQTETQILPEESKPNTSNPVLEWIIRLAKGILVGIGAIVPGLSGGVLMVVFGIYEPLIHFLQIYATNLSKMSASSCLLVSAQLWYNWFFNRGFDLPLPITLLNLPAVYRFHFRYIPFFGENFRQRGSENLALVLLFGMAVGTFFLFELDGNDS